MLSVLTDGITSGAVVAGITETIPPVESTAGMTTSGILVLVAAEVTESKLLDVSTTEFAALEAAAVIVPAVVRVIVRVDVCVSVIVVEKDSELKTALATVAVAPRLQVPISVEESVEVIVAVLTSVRETWIGMNGQSVPATVTVIVSTQLQSN